MRWFIAFLSICLWVLVIPDGFFSHDGIYDSTAADYQPTPHIDMSIFYENTDEILTASPTKSAISQKRQLPPSVYIHAPSYSQAPHGNRSLPWSMLCSEANLVLAAYAIKGKELTQEQFIEDMFEMIPLQEENFGTYFSIPMRDLKSVYDTMYPDVGRSWIMHEPSLEDLKWELAQWNIVIAPTAGRLLNNPFFINGWPRFHTILIVWYDEKYFYVNEVGMSNGRNFRYTHETVMHAMHDFVLEGDITQWDKLVMVVARE